MSRTPEDIKKGLECCISDTYGCNEKCPYFNSLSNGVDCAVKMHADALVLIQQLQADNAQLNRCIENMTDKLNAMNDEVAKLQAENAQLLRDVHGKCGACKWMYADGFERVCDPCLSEIKDNFEWRGVTKEGET